MLRQQGSSGTAAQSRYRKTWRAVVLAAAALLTSGCPTSNSGGGELTPAGTGTGPTISIPTTPTILPSTTFTVPTPTEFSGP